jgi:uncharacterized protein YbgA (DUF1722 family)/uncharacterized protein YbbK (DUF523 family)
MTDVNRPLVPPIRLGISSCLLGEKVRFDGGHKRDAFLVDTLGAFVEWVPVCPEVEVGMGTPRETLRLVGTPEAPRLIALRSQIDHTAAMQRYAARRLQELARLDLHGYVLKKNSPSCGMERVRVYGNGGAPRRRGRGVFAAALLERFPLLPVEEEGRLSDMRLRENFIERVFAYYRWQQLLSLEPAPRDLVRFHTQHKLTLMAHSQKHYRELGRLTAQAGVMPMPELMERYGTTLMEGLKVKATVKKHANVLYHLLGYLKQYIDGSDREEAVGCIESYRQQLVPLVVPLTLLKHHLRRHAVPWVLEQTYLQPYPAELMLRNHV